MAARSLPPARTGQNGCSLGLPSGRAVARNAIVKHGVPGGAGWPRPKAVMPGQSTAAAAAISGAPDSNSCQVATTPLSRYSRRRAALLSLTRQQRTSGVPDPGTAVRRGFPSSSWRSSSSTRSPGPGTMTRPACRSGSPAISPVRGHRPAGWQRERVVVSCPWEEPGYRCDRHLERQVLFPRDQCQALAPVRRSGTVPGLLTWSAGGHWPSASICANQAAAQPGQNAGHVSLSPVWWPGGQAAAGVRASQSMW
jgi:hypothetical protein